ncbi:neogenin-like [Tubulanus polymorphus]|uniref:neogenin-like n=1 Tax=Tubulanus polymorphus TaxID=672921 RepID=UPI003DA1D967
MTLFIFCMIAGSSPYSDFFFTVQPEDLVAVKDQPATLNCFAQQSSSLSPPTIAWRRDGEFINFESDSRRTKLENGSLYIERVVHTRTQRPDEGIYRCVATVPGLGSIVSRSAKLQIAYFGRDFVEQPPNHKLHLGDTVMFPCTMDGLPKPNVTWFKDEMELTTTDEMNVNNVFHKDGILEIRDIKFQDLGAYKCRAKNVERSKMSQVAQLTQNPDTSTYQGVTPTFIMKPKDQTVLDGNDAMLYCGANGRDRQGHKPTITWLKDGVTIDMSHLDTRYTIRGTGSLKIEAVKMADAGSYMCRATNLEESVDASAILSVHMKPVFSKKPKSRTARINEDILFECEVKGFPTPTVIWMKNGDQIIPNDYFQIVDGKHLRILGLVRSDDGIYQCMASNEVGNIQASAQLIIIQTAPPPTEAPSGGNHGVDVNSAGSASVMSETLPSKPLDLTPAIISTRFITLSWKMPEVTGNSEIVAYSVYWKELGSNRERVMNTTKTEANVQHLKPLTEYEFRVLAYNREGPSPQFATIKLNTKAEVHVPGPVNNVRLHVLGPRAIQVNWEKPERPNGDISRYTLYYYTVGDNVEKFVDVTGDGYRLDMLEPYTEYRVRIVAYNVNGRGISTDEFRTRTFSDRPGKPPQNVTLIPTSATTIIVRWEPPPKEERNGLITGYKIRYKKLSSRHVYTVTTDGYRRMYALTDLRKNTKYNVRLFAMTVNGSGPATEWVQSVTFPTDRDESRVPGQPSSLRVRPYTNSIVVSWTPPQNDELIVRGYELGYGIGHPDGYVQLLDSDKRYFTIKNLKSATEYVIRLQAYNEKGNGRPIYETVITREESTPEPQTPMLPPIGVRAIVLSPTTIVVTWSDTTLGNNQHITDHRYYTIRYSPIDSKKFRYMNSTDLNAHIDELKANTRYEFAVKVIKGRRHSTWSMSTVNKTFEAAPFSSPRDLTTVAVEGRETDIMINWQPPRLPNGHISGYLLFYTHDPTLKDRQWAVEGVLGDRLSTTIRDLKPDRTYYFKIQARNSKGYGPMSPVVAYHLKKESSDGPNFLWIVIGVIAGVTVISIAVVVIFLATRNRRNRSEVKNRKPGGYKASSKAKNPKGPQKDLKPPDLWIHHEQMELKGMDKREETSMTDTPIPRNSQDLDEIPLEKRRNSFNSDPPRYELHQHHHERRISEDRYRPMRPIKSKGIAFPVDAGYPRDPIAIATTIPNGHISDGGGGGPIPMRPVYPRTQYNTGYGSTPRVHAGDMSQPSSGPQSPESPSVYNQQYPLPYDQACDSLSRSSTPSEGSKSLPHRSGHPLKSFTMPSPPPSLCSVPGTPSRSIVKPQKTTSPYKNAGPSGSMKNRQPMPVITPRAPHGGAGGGGSKSGGEESDIPKSSSAEELSAEMANLEGIMKDLNAITQQEFEC